MARSRPSSCRRPDASGPVRARSRAISSPLHRCIALPTRATPRAPRHALSKSAAVELDRALRPEQRGRYSTTFTARFCRAANVIASSAMASAAPSFFAVVRFRLSSSPSGFATASEMFRAIDSGARHLKLFPAITYGPTHLKQLSAVLPKDASVWAVGGVGAANLPEWRKAGARAFGIGGDLYLAGQSVAATAQKAEKLVKAAASLPE